VLKGLIVSRCAGGQADVMCPLQIGQTTLRSGAELALRGRLEQRYVLRKHRAACAVSAICTPNYHTPRGPGVLGGGVATQLPGGTAEAPH